MKKMKLTTAILAIVFTMLAVTSCKESKKDAKASHTETAKTATAYACPMKCEGDKTYDVMGSCPKCGMDLKKVEKKADHSGHKH